MQFTAKQMKVINSFKKNYLKTGQMVCWNYVKYSKTSKTHQDRVNDICWWLYSNGIPFATETEFRTGYNPDIICPTINKIIEVRYSEREKETRKKEVLIPEELKEWVVLNDSKKPFDYKDLL